MVRRREQKVDLFKRGNVGLTRLLMIINNAGSQGITTVKLFEKLGSTGYGQTLLKRAEDKGLIRRKKGEREYGHFPPVFNILTDKGKKLLSQLTHIE